jgi:formylglycine-generating enzyme required for sulfatase activity
MRSTGSRGLARLGRLWALTAVVCLAVAAGLALSTAPAGAQDDATNPTLKPPIEWLPQPLEVADSLAATPAEMKPYTEVIAGTDITITMVPIPGGSLLMGSPDSEAGRSVSEGPQFTAEIGPFWMAECEMTWDQFDLWCMGTDKARRAKAGGDQTEWDALADAITQPTSPYMDLTLGLGREGFPAINMTQFAAKIYCKWLSAKTGRYYRLPTEAEWEYACRAGTTTAFSFGDDAAPMGDYAWFFDNADDQLHPVRGKQPNAWGLYDMHGNAMEWTLDKFTPDGYPVEAGSTVQGPLVAPEKIYPRAVRGGSFADNPAELRCASRRGSSQEWMKNDPQFPQSIWYHTDAWGVGFRVIRPFRVPSAEEAMQYDVDAAQAKAYDSYPKSRGH